MKYYTDYHEWVEKKLEEGVASIGLSQKAQKELGDVVYVELPQVGSFLKKGEPAAVVESTKAASDLYTPLSGEVVAVNVAVLETPSLVGSSPDIWLYTIRIANDSDWDSLICEADYTDRVSNLHF